MRKFRLSRGTGELTLCSVTLAYLISISGVAFWSWIDRVSTIPLLNHMVGRILETAILTIFISISISPNRFPIANIWRSSSHPIFDEKRVQTFLLLLCMATGLEFWIQTCEALYVGSTDSTRFAKEMAEAKNMISLPLTSWSLLFGTNNIVSHILITPLAEEYVFRGIFLNFFLMRFTAPVAILLSSVIFGGMHGGFLSAFFGSIFLGWLYLKFGKLWLCILLHSFANILIISFYTLGGGQLFILLLENHDLSRAISVLVITAGIGGLIFLFRSLASTFPSAFAAEKQ